MVWKLVGQLEEPVDHAGPPERLPDRGVPDELRSGLRIGGDERREGVRLRPARGARAQLEELAHRREPDLALENSPDASMVGDGRVLAGDEVDRLTARTLLDARPAPGGRVLALVAGLPARSASVLGERHERKRDADREVPPLGDVEPAAALTGLPLRGPGSRESGRRLALRLVDVPVPAGGCRPAARLLGGLERIAPRRERLLAEPAPDRIDSSIRDRTDRESDRCQRAVELVPGHRRLPPFFFASTFAFRSFTSATKRSFADQIAAWLAVSDAASNRAENRRSWARTYQAPKGCPWSASSTSSVWPPAFNQEAG